MASTQVAHALCSNCSSPLTNRFCPQCGEPAVHPGDMKLRHLTHEVLHEFTHVDGKIWKTLRALLFQPGLLTAEYWAGRRGKWIRPMRLYLVISALQLLLAANSAGPLGLKVYVTGDKYFVGTRPEAVKLSNLAPIDAEMSHKVQSTYLWIRYLSLGLFAAGSLALYRKRQPFYGAHIILGLHYYAFNYVISSVIARTGLDVDPAVPIGIGVIYLFFALKRVYGQKIPITLVKTVALFLLVSVAELAVVAGSVMIVAKRNSLLLTPEPPPAVPHTRLRRPLHPSQITIELAGFRGRNLTDAGPMTDMRSSGNALSSAVTSCEAV
jgi:Protein of unknown function (DUF3667)